MSVADLSLNEKCKQIANKLHYQHTATTNKSSFINDTPHTAQQADKQTQQQQQQPSCKHNISNYVGKNRLHFTAPLRFAADSVAN